jgi:hypothetical protein
MFFSTLFALLRIAVWWNVSKASGENPCNGQTVSAIASAVSSGAKPNSSNSS